MRYKACGAHVILVRSACALNIGVVWCKACGARVILVCSVCALNIDAMKNWLVCT